MRPWQLTAADKQHLLHFQDKILSLPPELRDRIYHWIWQGLFTVFRQESTWVFAYYGPAELGSTYKDLPDEAIFHHKVFREEFLQKFYSTARFEVGLRSHGEVVFLDDENYFRKIRSIEDVDKLPKREDSPISLFFLIAMRIEKAKKIRFEVVVGRDSHPLAHDLDTNRSAANKDPRPVFAAPQLLDAERALLANLHQSACNVTDVEICVWWYEGHGARPQLVTEGDGNGNLLPKIAGSLKRIKFLVWRDGRLIDKELEAWESFRDQCQALAGTIGGISEDGVKNIVSLRTEEMCRDDRFAWHWLWICEATTATYARGQASKASKNSN